MRGMGGRFKISVKSALLATFWVAAWFAVVAIRGNPGNGGLVGIFVMVCAPGAAFGALANHPTLGFLCGVTTGIAITVWSAITYP